MFRSGLLILFSAAAALAGLASASAQEPFTVVRDRFDLTGGPDAAVTMRVETTHRGHEAERFRAALGEYGLAGVAEQYELFYQQNFAGARLLAPLSVIDNGDSVVVTEAVELPSAYQRDADRGVYAFDFYAYAILDITRADPATGGLVVANPFHTRHETIVLLPAQDGEWAVPPETLNVSNAGFDFAFEARPGAEGLYLMAFELRSTADRVSPADAPDAAAHMQDALELAAWGFEIDMAGAE